MRRILFKFIEPQFLSDFLNGNVFFRRTGYFIELEKNSGDKVIGDRYEGSHFRHYDPNNESIAIKIDGKFVPLKVSKGFMTQRYDAAQDFQLSCFVQLKLDSDFILKEDKIYNIKEDVIEGLRKDFEGRKAILVHNEKAFFHHLDKSAREMGLGICHGTVNYFDPDIETPLTEEVFERNMIASFFYKRKSYQNQKEYRIITDRPVKKESMKIHTDDLKDYIQIFDLEDLSGLRIMTK
ncbi:hypothetical protein [Bacillus paralicheniformis]|uniref:hypothetical protein n=1 Tax=Bacillus paralicheniformis TaxID=1648923 RepID=UPI002E1B497A|nr:hypothetical protein [Bacillus paralicheniformis]